MFSFFIIEDEFALVIISYICYNKNIMQRRLTMYQYEYEKVSVQGKRQIISTKLINRMLP